MKKIKLTELMNPTFYNVWLTDKPNIILKGGRSSTKSSVVSMKLVIDFLKDEDSNVIVLRKVARYLSTSVYEQIKWAIYQLGVESEFKFLKSPLKIEHANGTAFYFYGVDDPQKLKSAKIAKGYVSTLWYEELAEFAGVEDIDVVQDTFIREDIGRPVKTYYTYNPPRSQYNWVNEWTESKKSDDKYFIHHSTYLDDVRGFLSKQMIEKIEDYKYIDEDYYKWMYLGEVIGLGDLVYNTNTFTPLSYERYQELGNKAFIIQDDPIISIHLASDAGHQVSATTTLALGITRKRNVVLLNTYYYSPEGKARKKPPSQLSKEIFEFRESIIRELGIFPSVEVIDSAEGAIRNQYFNDYNIRMTTVNKLKKMTMIDMATSIFATGRFYYIDRPENQVFIKEHEKYSYDGKSLETANPKVIDIDDHTCDAFQYFVVNAARELNLSW